MLTFSTSTPMFEPKRSESYTKCWLFPQCNRLRHTNIHGNCKCLYVRSTHQSATHAVIKTLRQLSPVLCFLPALPCSFWAILRPTKGSSAYGSSKSSSNWLLALSFFLVRFFRLHRQIELSVSERLPCIDEILVKISKCAFHLCTIRQVRFLKLHRMTSNMSRSAVMVSWTGASQKCRLQTIVKKNMFYSNHKIFSQKFLS